MKLHEEFKLYEDMWEDEVPATEDSVAEVAAEEASEPVTRTFGRKAYDLTNRDELYAWVKANTDFQANRRPVRYRNADGTITSDWIRLRSRIAKNLLASLEAEGITNPTVLDNLQRIATGNFSKFTKVFAKDELNTLFSEFTSKLSARFDAKEMRIVNRDLDALKQKLLDMKTTI